MRAGTSLGNGDRHENATQAAEAVEGMKKTHTCWVTVGLEYQNTNYNIKLKGSDGTFTCVCVAGARK